MTDLAENYFNTDYKSASLWFGLAMINLLANSGMMLFGPLKTNFGWPKEKSWWIRWAWGWMIGGNEYWYYFQGLVWCFSFIKKPFFQKSMFWSYIVGQGLAFFFTFVVNVMFLVGGILDNNDWWDLIWPLIYDVLFFGLNAITYYLLIPKMVAFYRWREQEWWNDKYTGWLEAGGIKLDFDTNEGTEMEETNGF